MNKPEKNISHTILLLMRWSRAARQQNQDGYAMLLVSVMAILIFSLLSVYLFSTNLYRSSANAIVDGSSTFFAAEAGLNKRASLTHAKFLGFSQPVGVAPTGLSAIERMQNCISGTPDVKGNGDYACNAEDFDYYEQANSSSLAQAARKKDKSGDNSKYTAYTFIQPNPRNLATYPENKKVPAGEPFAGLNVLEYSYRVYSTSVRRNSASDSSALVASQTLLQLDFNSRVIPLFQFAAFYENNLEINPSPNMSLNGPVHTNKSLYMAPGSDLSLQGQITSVDDIYKSMQYVANHANNGNPRIRVKIGDGVGDYFDISTLTAWNIANQKVDTTELDQAKGMLKPGIAKLVIPDPGFLSKVDQAGKVGEYYSKADFRVEFTPKTNLSEIPFKIEIANNGAGGELSLGTLRSLRQPVLFAPSATNITSEETVFCGATGITSSLVTSLNATQKGQVANALAAAIAAQPAPIPFSAMNAVISNTAPNSLQTTFENYLNLIGVTGADQAALLSATPANVAALSGRCFLPAPIQVITVNDRRETRTIQVLQTNMKSVVAWNRHGRTVDVNPDGTVGNTFAGQGSNTPDALYKSAPADAAAPALSYRRLGFSASDRTEGGLVWHLSIDKAVYPYPDKESIYGFGFNDGNNLPAPLTIATDQALYLQGDYNTLDKQPASTLADTITILSNACIDGERKLSCGELKDGVAGKELPVATETTVNAAFLSRTDETDLTQSPMRYSGGLNNYMRMLENWENVPFNYTGSFISLGTPQEFSGEYQPGKLGWGDLLDNSNRVAYYYYFPPIRNFAYDTSFNFANQLPPLTPKVVYLKQKVFKRDYDSNRE